MNIFSFICHWSEAAEQSGQAGRGWRGWGFGKVGGRAPRLWLSQIWRTRGPRLLIRSAAVQCHTRPVDPVSVECGGLHSKASNILLLLQYPEVKPDWLADTHRPSQWDV